jgi:hypothetical protein
VTELVLAPVALVIVLAIWVVRAAFIARRWGDLIAAIDRIADVLELDEADLDR